MASKYGWQLIQKSAMSVWYLPRETTHQFQRWSWASYQSSAAPHWAFSALQSPRLFWQLFHLSQPGRGALATWNILLWVHYVQTGTQTASRSWKEEESKGIKLEAAQRERVPCWLPCGMTRGKLLLSPPTATQMSRPRPETCQDGSTCQGGCDSGPGPPLQSQHGWSWFEWSISIILPIWLLR